jgi:spermidine synthase
VISATRVRQVIVAELEPAVVGWMSDGTIPHGPAIVTDPRVAIRAGDVRDVVTAQQSASLDAILLDVDNGPGFLVYAANAEVYTSGFLGRCVERLRPGGLLAVWSSTRSVPLEHALSDVTGSCEVRPMPVDLAGRAEEYVLYLATAQGQCSAASDPPAR